MNELIEKMTFGPARAFDWKEKGHLSIGATADLVLIDPKKKWQVNSAEFYTRGKATPFEGHKFTGRVIGTMVEGKWVYQDGKVLRS